MYGTVARIKVKPGGLEKIKEVEQRRPDGLVGSLVFQMDSDPNELFLVVLFRDRESYIKNADSPEQNDEYQQMRALMLSDPEWNDGIVVFDSTPISA